MKKILVILLAATVVLAFAATAFADWAYDFEQYETPGTYPSTTLCKVVRTGSSTYDCNGPVPPVYYTNYASVAQWIHLHASSTRMDWQVLKPGNYFTDSVHLEFNSNGDVDIILAGFGNLVNAEGDEILKYYWLGLGFPPTDISNWYPAGTINADYLIPEDQNHEICYVTLWEKIHVVPCNSACEYWNTGTITFELKEQKDWVATW